MWWFLLHNELMSSDWLPRALEESRARGFLSPQSLDLQIDHANGFGDVWDSVYPTPPASLLDLGSGGGLPGLVLLNRWANQVVFLDSMKKRSSFLEEILEWPGVPRATVVCARAEEAARWPEFDGFFDLVTARSFGSPSSTAECGVRFLRIGGALIVSEPPDDNEPSRWSGGALRRLGLKDLGRVRRGAAFRILEKVAATSPEFPRSIGTPKKKPLF